MDTTFNAYYIYIDWNGDISIVDVILEKITPMEDVSVAWLPIGQYRARVLEPKFLYEKQLDGSLAPPIWHSHSFYSVNDIVVVWDKIEKIIRAELQRQFDKHGVVFTEEEVKAKLAQVKEVSVP
jgi:hypothetical protein